MATNRVLPSKRITKRSVDALKCPENRDRTSYGTRSRRGFEVAAFRGGKKTDFIQYRQHGRTRRYAIGEHGTLTPDEARKRRAGTSPQSRRVKTRLIHGARSGRFLRLKKRQATLWQPSSAR